MIIVFDTDCVLCSGWVGFILRHEAAPTARFVSAWSDEGAALATAHGLSPADLDLTFLVVPQGRPALTKSDAGLAILAELRAPWSWARVLRLVPRGLRDWVYDRIARNRYDWFGRRSQCYMPPVGQAHRFVSAAPVSPEDNASS